MPLTKATEVDVQKLLTETGHALNINDLSYILRLDAVNKRIADGEDCAESIAAKHSVRVGNLILKRPCIGALEWYEARAEWFADNAALSDCAFVFASVAKHPGTLWALTDRDRARRAVKRFRRKLSCTMEELHDGFVRLFGSVQDAVELTEAPDAKEIEASVATIARASEMNHEATFNAIKHEAARLEAVGKNEPNYGPLIAMLCREFGSDPMTWKWNTPIEIVDSCTKDFEMRMDAQDRELAKASGGRKEPPKRTTRNLLIKEARLIGNEMKARWEATDGA
jgi:hypothetical protein